MIAFKSPQLSDRTWVEPLFYAAGNRGCENNFTNLFVWQEAYRQKLARFADFVLVRYDYGGGAYSLYPAGIGDERAAVEALLQDARERGERLELIGVTPEQIAKLEQWYPGKFSFVEDRDGYDYLYLVERLATLRGKKLQAKRNHINRFIERYPEWQAIELDPDNLSDCARVERIWQAEKETAPTREDPAVAAAMQHFEALGLEGLMIVTRDGPVAFTMGRRMTADTYDVHFEKADAEIQGAYAIVNREFARLVQSRYPEVIYLNREDDLGLPGLRRAKESYGPDQMVEKHRAFWRGESDAGIRMGD
jgi:hypothetical protein